MLSMTAVAALEEDSVEVVVEEDVEAEEEETAVAAVALYSEMQLK